MTDKILRRPEVEARVGLSRSAIYAAIAKGSFPSPVKISKRAVGWRESQINRWIRDCITSKNEVNG